MTNTDAPRIHLGPTGGPDWLADAVIAGGGELVGPDEAEGVVWADARAVDALRETLDARARAHDAGAGRMDPDLGAVEHLGELVGRQRAVQRGAKLIVADPRKIDLVKSPHVKAQHHLALRPGTNVAVINALAHVAVTEGLTRDDYVAERCESDSYQKWKKFIAAPRHSPEATEAVTGVPAAAVLAAASRNSCQECATPSETSMSPRPAAAATTRARRKVSRSVLRMESRRSVMRRTRQRGDRHGL